MLLMWMKETKMPRVFILEKPRRELDFHTAEAYGSLVYMFEDNKVNRPGVFDTNAFVESVFQRFRALHFDFTCDHLLIAGSLINVSLTVSSVTQLLLHTNQQALSLLLYSSIDNKYVQRIITPNLWEPSNA